MECFKKINSNLKESYNKGFKISIKTVILYAFFSSGWIITSDAIASIIFTESEQLEKIQMLKGIFFVFSTSLFLLVLLWRNYEEIMQYKEAYEKSEISLNELKYDSNLKNNFYNFMTEYLIDNDASPDEILVDAFHFIFNKIEVCDMGSVFKFENNNVLFLDAVGYDLENLNETKMEAAAFESLTFNVDKNKVPEMKLKKELGAEKYSHYSSDNPSIQESVYVGLIETDGNGFGISVDISQNSWDKNKRTFSEAEIKELSEFQLLMTALFRMKAMVGIKGLLQRDIVNSLISTLEHHDVYTKGHSESVGKISLDIGKKLNLNSRELKELHWAATIHDIGKLVVPKDILNKVGELTKEEIDLIKKHPETGADFLSRSESLRDIAKYVKHHHERWDGKGYPSGLKGEEIPFYSRIICVADTYHAMTSDRPYQKGLDKKSAIRELIKNKGLQLCPISLDAFLRSAADCDSN
jgi:HD-GYP domain-containing protein (c-di-GMP phosphodiesterase class II)